MNTFFVLILCLTPARVSYTEELKSFSGILIFVATGRVTPLHALSLVAIRITLAGPTGL